MSVREPDYIKKDQLLKLINVMKYISRSAVFDRMLDHNMMETQTGEVDIFDVDPETLKRMLEFIYTGQVVLTFSKLFCHNR